MSYSPSQCWPTRVTALLFNSPVQMSSKSKWDQPATGSGADDSSEPKSVVKDSKSASEAAAAAAAIAAKIAAQFANGTLGQKDHDNEYWKDIDINDVRNRYVLTKGSTQQQACSQIFL